jgi:1-acyl-sn-glycerol-3-phosphate acyltransferase
MNVPILPVAVTGSDKLRNLWWCFLHRPRITITIGQPFSLPPGNGKPTREQRQQMIDFIMRKVADLLPPEYRGVYAAEKNTDN